MDLVYEVKNYFLFLFISELLTSHLGLGRVPSRVTSHEGRVRVESRVTEISARVESSNESQGLESSRVTQSCRVMPESDIIFNIWKVNLKLKYLYLLYT